MRGNALFCVAVLCAATSAGPYAHATGTRVTLAIAANSINHGDRLAGRSFHWSLTEAPIPGMTCQETWSFNDDGTVRFQSNAEVTTHSYSLYQDPASGVTLMRRTRLTSNGAPDCTGAQDPATGQVRETILRFQTDGTFLTCTDVTVESCFGKAVALGRQVALK